MPSTVAPAPPPPPPVNPTEGALKAVLIVTLFLATFLASMFAFVLKRHAIQAHSPRAVVGFSLVSCFGAGVFLGTCLLDLLPDSVECVQKAFKFLQKDVDFPVAEFCVVMGFLMVLFIEQTIIYAREKNWIGDTEVERLLGDHHDQDHGLPDSPSAGPEAPLGDESHDVHFDPESHSSIRAILLVCALSLHAVFEGLSLGLITQVPVLLQVFGALFIHKSIIGFSLGVRLVQSRLRNMTVVICCTIFAAQVLIGGFFGYGIIKFMDTSSKGTTHLVSGILQSIACGTFLYITSFEILPHELNQRGHRPLKFVLLLLGFFVVAGFVFMFPDQDDD